MILKPVVWIVDKKEVKNFTWPEANHLPIYERDWEAALRTIKKKEKKIIRIISSSKFK